MKLLKVLIASAPFVIMADEKLKLRFILTVDLYALNADNIIVNYVKLVSLAKIYKKKLKSIIHFFLVHAVDVYSPYLLSAMD